MLPTYVTADYYLNDYAGSQECEGLERKLLVASRHIDHLTFNRLIGKDLEKDLTAYQRDALMWSVCALADFENENADLIESVYSSYALNGVSASFNTNGWNVRVENGVAIRADVYEMLETTGLCDRRI